MNKDQLTPEQRDDYEERAAILQFEAGLSREEAEKKAMEIIKKGASTITDSSAQSGKHLKLGNLL